MKVARIAASVAALLVIAYLIAGALRDPSSNAAAPDGASTPATAVVDQNLQTVPMPQVSNRFEPLPASNAEQVYAPEKKAQ